MKTRASKTKTGGVKKAGESTADERLLQLKALIGMAALVNSSLDIRQIKRRAIHAAAELLDAETGSLILIDQETGELFFEVALEKSDGLDRVRLRRGEGIAGWVAEHGIPQIIHDVASDERFYRNADKVSGFSTRNMICVPVKTRERRLGVLEVVNKHRGVFDENDMEMLVAFANHVALAMDNALLYEENIRQLKSRLMEERRHAAEKAKIVKDLHDGIGGITTNISLLAQLGQKKSSLEEVRKLLSTIADLTREGLAEIKSFMYSLDIGEGNWHTLVAEMRRIGSSMVESHDVTLVLNSDVDEETERPGSLLSLNIFRIFKEAITNVIKHAGARNVSAIMSVRPERLLLTIKDDGIGLKIKNKGRGLANMRTRAEEIGGVLTILSDSGTLVRLEVPLPLKYPMEGIEI